MARNVIQVGADVVCRINGKIIGSVTGLQYRLLSPRVEERGIDCLTGFELAPTGTSITGTIQIVMVRNNEGVEATGATSGLPEVLNEPYFALHIEDRANGFSILKASQASVEEQTWDIRARGIVMGQIVFKGLLAANHFNQ